MVETAVVGTQRMRRNWAWRICLNFQRLESLDLLRLSIWCWYNALWSVLFCEMWKLCWRQCANRILYLFPDRYQKAMYMEYSQSAAVDRSLLHPWSSDVYERCLSLMSTNFWILSNETYSEGWSSRLLAVVQFLRNTIDIERFRIQNLSRACRRSRA